MFKRVLAERKVEVYTGKDVVDVRDPPEGVAGGTGTLVCSDGSEVGLPPHASPPSPSPSPAAVTVELWLVAVWVSKPGLRHCCYRGRSFTDIRVEHLHVQVFVSAVLCPPRHRRDVWGSLEGRKRGMSMRLLRLFLSSSEISEHGKRFAESPKECND